MAEVLSQSQIDALMREMQSGSQASEKKEEKKEEKKYRKYDFYSPKKITKDKIKLLHGIYDNYSRIASSRMNGILRIGCELQVLSVEEQRYYEFNNALGENDIIITQTISLPNKVKTSPILVHINQMPMVAMIDCMLGGDGTCFDSVDSNYSYTDIELPLYKKIMNYFLDFTKDAWSNYIQLETDRISVEENPSLFQEISLDETVAIIILKIEIAQSEGLITVCIPRNLLSEIFKIIDSKKNVFDSKDTDSTDTRNIILSKIRKSALGISADMGTMQITVRDIHDIKVGDIINLDRPKDSPVYLNIEGMPWLKGQLGTYKNDVAVLVENRLDTQQENTQAAESCDE